MTDAKKSSVKAKPKPKAVWKSKPDWTKKEDYPDPNIVEMNWVEWAWEFLRRNPKYRKDYESVQKRIEELISQHGYTEETWSLAWEANVYTPELSPTEKAKIYEYPIKRHFFLSNGEKAWRKRVEDMGMEPRKVRIDRLHAENWGLLFNLVDPDIAWNDNLSLFSNHGLPRIITSLDDAKDMFEDSPVSECDPDGSYPVDILKPGLILVAFDTSRDMPSQFQAIQKRVNDYIKLIPEEKNKENEDKKKKRLRVNLWHRYLRVLDALSAKAKTKEIAEILDYSPTRLERKERHPGPEIKIWIKEAKRIRDEGYRDILDKATDSR